MPRDSQSRKYQLTINNPQDKELTQEKLKKITETNFKSIVYYCMSDEVGGNENTYHTHLYLQLKSPTRFSRIKKVYPEAHIESCKGTAEQNRDYVFKQGKWESDTKAETNLRDTHYEYGELPQEKQGKRSDLEDLYLDIKQGLSNAEILEANPSHLERLSHIDKVRKTVLEEKYKSTWRDLTVSYIFGSTAVGKTRSIMEHYGYENVYRVTDYKHPFDSYQHQRIIIFDEYDGQLPLRSMLNYLDGYPLELPARYANRIACFTTVFIISNNPIDTVYTHEQQSIPKVWEAFMRRIHSVIQMDSPTRCYVYRYLENGDQKLILPKNLNEPISFLELATKEKFKTKFNKSFLPKGEIKEATSL